MGLRELKPLDEYWIWLQHIDDDDYLYRSILWVDDDGYYDGEPKTKGEILDIVLSEKPDYIVLEDLRYVKSSKIDEYMVGWMAEREEEE